jgi:hypothetical protein
MLEPRTWCSALALLLAMSCTDHHVSTETGNPPVIDSTKVSLVVMSDSVFVRGEPGAVKPAPAKVEITIVSSGEVVEGPVAADGSFNVEVDATAQDAFEVRAIRGEEMSEAVYVVLGGAAIGGGEEGSLSCSQRTQVASGLVDQAAGNADRSCVSDADCVAYVPDPDCSGSCWVHYLSNEGAAEADVTREIVNATLCADFEAEMCTLIQPDCFSAPMEPVCEAGTCRSPSPDNCDECVDSELHWTEAFYMPGPVPAIQLPSFTVSDCNRFATDFNECFRLIDRCGSANQEVSVFLLKTALDHPDVVAALEAGGAHGSPVEQTGEALRVTYGGQTATFRVCEEEALGCSVAPGIQTLFDLLKRAEGEHQCEMALGPCRAPYSGGTEGVETQGYWFDPEVRTCVPRTFTGAAVNANRHENLVDCEAKCPGPSAQFECDELERVFVGDACTTCGQPGGCGAVNAVCLKRCAEDADCAGESFAKVCDADSLCVLPACF